MKLARIMVIALALSLLAASTSFGAVIAFRTGTLNEIAVNAQTGLVGNIGLVPLVSGSIPANEIVNVTFNYPISATSTLTVTTVGSVCTWTTGAFGAATCTGATPPVVTADANHIAILYNVAVASVLSGESFLDIQGARVNVYPTGSVDQRVSATITSALGQIAVTDPDVDVAVLREPIKLELDSYGNSISTRGDGSATAILKVSELFTNGFESFATDGTVVATNPTQVRIALTIPTGLTLSAIGVTNGTATVVRQSAVNANPVLVDITIQDSNVLEYFYVNATFLPSVVPVPLTIPAVTATATLYPAATAFPVRVGYDAPGTATVVEGRLCYGSRAAQGAPVSIAFTAFSLDSELLSLFNVTMAPVASIGFAGYETGIAIQNASPILDYPNPGTIEVYLYKANAATPVTFTTGTAAATRPGTGLDASGQLPAGGTWTVLLSQLLTAAGVTGDWEGMVYFYCNFSAATGVSYIADPSFAVQAQGYQMVDVYQWWALTYYMY